MITKKPNIKEFLEIHTNKSLLLIGKEGIFLKDEIKSFLKRYDIKIANHLEDNTVAVVEHSNLNPIEEMLSYEAYDKKLPIFRLVEFEKFISLSIDENEVLMAIRLSNDQKRVLRLLSNQDISDTLFVKLLTIYKWHEDEEDSSEDRDVIMYLLRRYISIKPNEEDLLYTYLTLRRLAVEAKSAELLFALTRMPNFKFLIRDKKKITLMETIARNSHIDKKTITRLLSFRDNKIEISLALNRTINIELLHKFLGKKIIDIDNALATNINIDDYMYKELLSRDEKSIRLLLLWQPVDEECLKLIDSFLLNDDVFATIGANEQLKPLVIDELISRDKQELLLHLAQNSSLSKENLDSLYKKNIEEVSLHLASNNALSKVTLYSIYDRYNQNEEIVIELAKNIHIDRDILKTLFEKDNFKIHQSLALNSSTPIEILNILKIDTRLRNELTKNSTFVANITQKLGL